ncbi:hypothetical protein EV426DRAFT_645760 [Tirmania nivea]|nr:hypothetical protein EV426DRAFT_645760 [Tirmania nivea]
MAQLKSILRSNQFLCSNTTLSLLRILEPLPTYLTMPFTSPAGFITASTNYTDDGPPVSTTLPPVGTIFELIPAEPTYIDDFGVEDNETDMDDTSAHGECTSGNSLVIESQSESYPPSSNVTIPLQKMDTASLHKSANSSRPM